MIVLVAGSLVLPDRVLANASLLIDDGHIVGIEPEPVSPAGAEREFPRPKGMTQKVQR